MSDYVSIDFNEICIRSGRERREVTEEVCKLFNELLNSYIEKNMKKIKVRPVSIIFQNPKTPYKRNNHRSGVVYFENTLTQVVSELPSLGEDEYYEFPSIEFVLERDGTGNMYLRYA